MFHSPEKTSVEDSDMELLIASAIINGRSVPRSPSDPEISERSDLRNAEKLVACFCRRLVSTAAIMKSVSVCL